jgi:membrane fusion protein, multidrug efflux system
VIDTGTLTGIDNQVDQTTGTVKLKAEFPNPSYQLWPGQFVNVRLKIDTLKDATVVPTSAVQRGPAGTFSYVIGEGDIVKAVPVTVTQQNELSAVIAKGLSASDRVVTTGFANLSDGAKVSVGTNTGEPTADLAPRKRGGSKGSDAGERRSKRGQGQQHGGEGNPSAPMGQTAPAAGPSNAPQGAKQP